MARQSRASSSTGTTRGNDALSICLPSGRQTHRFHKRFLCRHFLRGACRWRKAEDPGACGDRHGPVVRPKIGLILA
jgi:hypothetical protein